MNADLKTGLKPDRQSHTTICLTVIVLLLAIIAWSVLRASAALNYRAALHITTTMLDTQRQSLVNLKQAEAFIKQALVGLPGNPDYLDLAGRIKALQASQSAVVGKQQKLLLGAAIEFYRQALSVRPLWPYSWANLLWAKDQAGALDEEFHLAFNRSMATGPREPVVQLQVLNSGLRHWQMLTPTEQIRVKVILADALKVQPRQVFDITRSFGRTDLICAEAVTYQQITHWCEEEGRP